MKIAPFQTEHFFAKYEFNTPHQLCNSDCETVSVGELMEMAGVPMEKLGQLPLSYTDSYGNPQLRAAIAESYAGIRPEEILLLGTPVEGIYLVARAVLNPGDEVIVLSPAYDALINLFEHVVGKQNVRKWRFTPAEGKWELDFDQLEELVSPQTKLLVVNFPHNPTGYLPSREQFDRIIEFAENHSLLLFCDEMYSGLIHSGTVPIRSAAELSRRAVVLSGLSKTYGLPGLRTGWLVIQDEKLRREIVNWKFYTSICAPGPSEFLAQVAWSVREQLRQRSIRQIEQNLQLAGDFFERWPGLFTWRPPMAGSTALVGMAVPSVTEFAAQMVERAGVLILPATNLGWDDQHMRIGLGRAAFGSALAAFENYLKSQ